MPYVLSTAGLVRKLWHCPFVSIWILARPLSAKLAQLNVFWCPYWTLWSALWRAHGLSPRLNSTSLSDKFNSAPSLFDFQFKTISLTDARTIQTQNCPDQAKSSKHNWILIVTIFKLALLPLLPTLGCKNGVLGICTVKTGQGCLLVSQVEALLLFDLLLGKRNAKFWTQALLRATWSKFLLLAMNAILLSLA